MKFDPLIGSERQEVRMNVFALIQSGFLKIFAFVETNATKVGLGGLLGSMTLESWSTMASLTVAVLTAAALIPVIWTRWRKLFKGEDPTNT